MASLSLELDPVWESLEWTRHPRGGYAMRRALIGTALTAIALCTRPAQRRARCTRRLGPPDDHQGQERQRCLAVRPDQHQHGFKEKPGRFSSTLRRYQVAASCDVSTCVAVLRQQHRTSRRKTCTDGSDRQRLHATRWTPPVSPMPASGHRASAQKLCAPDGSANMFDRAVQSLLPDECEGDLDRSGADHLLEASAEYTPGVYRLVQRSKFRNAVASGTLQRQSARRPVCRRLLLGFGHEERGKSCGTASGGVRTGRVLTTPPQAPKCRSGARKGLRGRRRTGMAR